MPTLAELAQMSDNAYVGYPQLQRQANRMRLAQIGRIPENLPDPRTYGFVKGLTGTSPDELEMSVLSPNTAPAKDAAYYGYQLSNLGQMTPAMMPATKAALRTAGNAVNDAMVYGTGPLARITPQPMFAVNPHQSNLRNTQKLSYPQQEVLRLAQERAALPIKEGGLGLPKDNTPEMRAQAMGGKEMVHFSRSGGDYTTLDSGKFAIAPFDAVGTHVGTPQAALERYENTIGYKVNNPNYANDELKGVTYPVTILGKKPLMNQNGMPFGEDDLNAFLRQQGGHDLPDINGEKLTYQNMNARLRKKLFEEQGYTSIPYYNEVEGKGSISYIVPPENIRSRFAAFDPFRKDVATATAMGVALPDLLAKETKEKKKKSK